MRLVCRGNASFAWRPPRVNIRIQERSAGMRACSEPTGLPPLSGKWPGRCVTPPRLRSFATRIGCSYTASSPCAHQPRDAHNGRKPCGDRASGSAIRRQVTSIHTAAVVAVDVRISSGGACWSGSLSSRLSRRSTRAQICSKCVTS
jgi:hypothetical protein